MAEPEPEPESKLDKCVEIMVDLCMDYGYMIECSLIDRLDKRHTDLLFGISLFEDSVFKAQEYFESLEDTQAIDDYMKKHGREGYDSVDDLLRLETNLWNEQFR